MAQTPLKRPPAGWHPSTNAKKAFARLPYVRTGAPAKQKEHAARRIPLAAAVTIWVIFAAVVVGVGAFAWHYKHTPHLVQVSQKEIDSVSTLSRTLGSPVSTLSDDHTLHLVVYYDGYKNDAVAQHYVGLIQATLRETEPYKSAKNLQVTVFTSPVSQCHTYKSVKTLLLCNDTLRAQVNKLGFKHFKLLVMSPLDFAPSASVARGKNSTFYLPTYQGALTQAEVDTFVSLYFLHEFGHSFGLRDEYARVRYGNTAANTEADSGNDAYTAALPNCAKDQATAQAWWGAYISADIATLQQGCAGNPDYYYPVAGTVMSGDPTDATYGRVNEDYLRGVLDCFYGDSKVINFPTSEKIPDGVSNSCSTFTAKYPNFWKN